MTKGTRGIGIVGGSVAFFVCTLAILLPLIARTQYRADEAVSSQALGTTTAPAVTSIAVTHVDAPQAVKAIYMTACVASVPSWRDQLMKMVDDTELNAIVVDIKDYTGTISFVDPSLQPDPGPGCRVKDMQEFVAKLHEHGIYVIGRVTVFQDPFYAKLHPELAIQSKSTGGVWKDKKGLAFIDVGAKPYWDHVVDIAKKSYALGFDEINFDYVRYPSDGNLKDMNTTWTVGTSTKAEMDMKFFEYLHQSLAGTGMKTSADLFGLVTVAEDDLGIGQVLTNALPYFDYVYPMVYPSHFAPGSDGFAKPAEHPYEIIKWSMENGVKREMAQRVALGLSTSTPSKLRPWIQDFDLGATYNAPEVRAEMKAAYDAGLPGWLSWDASNKYTPDAYSPETSATIRGN